MFHLLFRRMGTDGGKCCYIDAFRPFILIAFICKLLMDSLDQCQKNADSFLYSFWIKKKTFDFGIDGDDLS